MHGARVFEGVRVKDVLTEPYGESGGRPRAAARAVMPFPRGRSPRQGASGRCRDGKWANDCVRKGGELRWHVGASVRSSIGRKP
jgi:hypothetical protein